MDAKEIVGKALTFTQKSPPMTELLAANMRWLRIRIKGGVRILDIGIDTSRAGRGGLFYKAEVALLEKLGFKRQFRHFIEVDGKKTAVYEWMRAAQ